MKCTYCDCLKEGTKTINGWQYCDIHFEKLSQVKITNKTLGHQSKYEGEIERDFDTVDAMNWSKKRTFQGDEERNGYSKGDM